MMRKSFTRTTFGVVYLGLVTNLLLAVAGLPLLVLLICTNPALSWPYLAAAAVLAAPALSASFTVFRDHQGGDQGPFRAFLAGYRATWRKALAVAAGATAVVVVGLIDVRSIAGTTAGIVLVPALLVLAALALGTGMVSLVALSEAPSARLRDIVKAAAVLAVRRWYLTLVSLLAATVQVALFANRPALAVGVSAAAVLYLIWGNSRYSLRSVLDLEAVPAVRQA